MTKLETVAALTWGAIFVHGFLKTVIPYSGWFWTLLVQANS